ncbi:HAD-IIIC family phosphatase [Amycolatopsis sp. NPDC051071]|uniref:HAD-IIIC family phosphatase n=1 Tax=Amycolatopsis sp. NPDC051071 TaxID=3154637 RepID=UPI0034424253
MNDFTELLDGLRAAVAARSAPSPGLRQRLAGLDDPATVRRAGRILAELPPSGPEPRPIRVAVLATCTIGPFEHLLRATLVATGTQPTLLLGDYGTFDLSLAAGEIGGSPDVVTCLLDERYFLPREWSAVDPDGLAAHVAARFADLRGLILACLERTPAAFVLHTVPIPAELRDSVISWRARATVGRAWHRLNADLLGLAEEDSRITVVDLAGELADVAVACRDDRLHRYADLPYTDGALLVLARQVARVVAARSGLSRKVLALDLDNTLWGGVLGETGEAGLQLGGLYPGNCYQALQRVVRRLREQGVILVLASKNDAGPVDEALANHPEMLLRPQDFAVRAVNWSAKAENLRHAAETLNLAASAFVFMDDSPFERGHVAAELPGVAVVAADGDPAYLVRSLLRSGWFDVPELTDTDLKRPALYRSRALRTGFSTGFASSEDYLRALRTQVISHPVTAFETGRVAQLAARTNQFNLTGVRFDEGVTTAMSTDPDHLVASFTVSDRFGHEGIVGAAWIERRDRIWRVLNLVLSCRVFGRGIEFAIADWIVGRAREAGATALVGRYVPTNRNSVAAGFWEKAGFTPSDEDGTYTVVPATAPTCLPTWITDPETK